MPERTSAELELALSEVIHRARNDLQTVAAMLQLQAQATSKTDARTALLEAGTRIHALARLNARLDAEELGEEGTVDARAFLNGLVNDLAAAKAVDFPVAVSVEADACSIPTARAQVLGLITNELVINALKYAFSDAKAGSVHVAFSCRSGSFTLTVSDTGAGMDPTAAPHGTGLGQRLVRGLAGQLGGNYRVAANENGTGTTCVVEGLLH